MELHDALSQISEIRLRMARGQVFRGYRAATTAATAGVALAAAAAQAAWVPDPAASPVGYLAVWLSAAAASMLIVGVEMAVRCIRCASPLHRQMTLLAVDQFMPTVVAGGLVTFAVARFAPASLWVLPGLWAVLFGLGVFASRKFLPRGIFLPAGYYLLAGTWCLSLGPDGTDTLIAALSPWTMGGVFAAGQLLTAAVLYWTLERRGATRGQD